MDTDCLTESEFIDWHCFDFHIKIWNNQRIEKFIYSTYERQEVINYIKKEYPDCINFQFQMSGYDDPLNWEQIAEDKQTINKLINMDDKLKDIIPLKDYFPKQKPKQLEFNFN